ncbi:bifunctional methylenetetrahydrofolate dehydrogenase/methenyltetrahydrofolate cyclohydrolase [Candidatus Micrarchaeota archaeon CG10_big_fil_rev_8_21_14_0_10_45_29]|nr:MAG: bifunctional methylenetetrahydrofolate dehydrogenase/methenyltetrahydrofolate cyclohydrolase [Candidatus Micrarchaeota archaeon CG10_big_fil_rev_8_21_14_0_10_45_29]
MAKLLDGKEASSKWLEDIKKQASLLQPKPKLVIINSGDDAASQIYVRNKVRACKECGVSCELLHYPASASTAELLSKIKELNKDASVSGMIVQLPLPSRVDVQALQEAIEPLKDADGFTPENQRLLEEGKPRLVAATPAGVMRLLEHYNLDVTGKNCVVMGRSKIVGKPLAALLRNAGAKVEVVHSKTENPASITSKADFLFIAIGKPRLVGASMVKEGAVVIDIGMNRDENGKVCGDADFEEVKKKASCITPVPGGVGKMTVASLLANTLKAYKMQNKIQTQ